jgi:hypothetical protein
MDKNGEVMEKLPLPYKAMSYHFIWMYLLPLQLLLASVCTGQETYHEVRSIVEKRMSSYPQDSINTRHVRIIFQAFDQAEKPDFIEYSKRNFGLAFSMSDEDGDVTGQYAVVAAHPALYTYNDGKMDISAVRTPAGKEPDPGLKEYTDAFMKNPLETGGTTVFQFLWSSKRECLGRFMENQTELVVQEPDTLSFIRSDKDWTYIISMDIHYKTLSKPGIILYVFKKTYDGPNIFDISSDSR